MTALAIVIKYWREILIALAIALLIGAGLYIRHVFNERDDLRTINGHLSAQLDAAARMQELTNRVTEAISQIKIRSQVNVSKIESEAKPQFVDNSAPVVFIPGGMLQAVYSSTAAHRAPPGSESGGSLATGEPVR
jgi:hypothetical protein